MGACGIKVFIKIVFREFPDKQGKNIMILTKENKKSFQVYLFFIALFFCLALSFFSCTKKEKVLKDQDLYNQAMDYMGRKKLRKAAETLQRLENEYPESPLMAKTRLNSANVHYKLEEFDLAREEYERFLNFHPLHPESDLARFRIAKTYFEEVLDTDRDQTFTIKALEAFERFLKEYPQSSYVTEAKVKVAECRLKLAEQDLYVARFYLKTGAYRAARGRLKRIWDVYPEVLWRDEVLFLLSQTYKGEGMEDEAQHVMCKLSQEFPESQFAKKVQTSCQEIGLENLP